MAFHEGIIACRPQLRSRGILIPLAPRALMLNIFTKSYTGLSQRKLIYSSLCPRLAINMHNTSHIWGFFYNELYTMFAVDDLKGMNWGVKESKNRNFGYFGWPANEKEKIIMWDKTIVFHRYTRQMERKFARWH